MFVFAQSLVADQYCPFLITFISDIHTVSSTLNTASQLNVAQLLNIRPRSHSYRSIPVEDKSAAALLVNSVEVYFL